MVVAIVTGGANGIGKAVVQKLLNKGHSVVIGDISSAYGEAAVAELGGEKNSDQFANCMFVPCDITKDKDWEKLVEMTIDKFGRIDALVNNAGILGPKNQDVAEMDSGDFLKCLDVNVVGAQRGVKAVMESLRNSDDPVIVNTSSQGSSAGTAPPASIDAYVICKSAVDMFTRRVVGCHPTVRCYSMNPCFFDTKLANGFVEIPTIIEAGLSTFESACFVLNPLGKVGNLEKLAEVYVHAIEGNFHFDNGTNVGVYPNHVDGVNTYDVCGGMLGPHLHRPTPWPFEHMVDESFVHCDETGKPLDSDESIAARAALVAHKETFLKLMAGGGGE